MKNKVCVKAKLKSATERVNEIMELAQSILRELEHMKEDIAEESSRHTATRESCAI